jgi:hypothetical protein
MSFRLSSFGPFPCVLAAGATAFLAFGSPGADTGRGRSIEFSEPRSAETITNLNQLTTKKDSLKQLEADLYKPFQSIAPKTSLDGFYDPPPQRQVRRLSKQAKEKLEKQRDWIFVDPDDASAGPTAESIFNLPQYDENGQEKKKLSVFEQYYQNEERKRTEKAKAKSKAEELLNSDKDSDLRDDSSSNGDRKSSNGSGDREQGLYKLFGNDQKSAGPTITHGTLTDIFGFGEKTQSAENIAKHNAAAREQMNSLFSSGWQPPSDSFKSPSSFSDTTKPAFNTPGAWDSLPGSSRKDNSSSLAGSAPSFNSSYSHSSVSDFGTKSAVTPVVTPAPATKITPQAPTFTAPRRSFQ